MIVTVMMVMMKHKQGQKLQEKPACTNQCLSLLRSECIVHCVTKTFPTLLVRAETIVFGVDLYFAAI